MIGIDENLTFLPLNIAVLSISDTRTLATDESGQVLVDLLAAAGHNLAARAISTDDVESIRAQVRTWIDDPAIDVVLTTGGTGFMPRDVTPEAIRPLFAREMDGFSVVYHQACLETVGISTLQSRAFAGQADETFVFCLPGSPGACRDAWNLVLNREFDSRHRPCSLTSLIPRLAAKCS